MSKPRFFQAVLKEVKGNVLDHVYPHLKGNDQLTMAERMGSDKANCPDCDCNCWVLLPTEGVMVTQDGKPYCECMNCKCMNCGLTTHL